MAQFKSFVVAIADIKTGTRHRKDMGDLDALAASLREIGMLQPVGITPDKTLVFGERRLRAAKLLGWTQVPALVFESLTDAVAALKAERDENKCREEMVPSEYVELGRALEAVERAEAEKRQKSGAKTDLPEPVPEGSPVKKGDTRDKVGEALGISGKTYEQAKTVVDKAPELVEAMDSGALSVKTAAKVAKLPAKERKKVAKAADPKKAAKEVLAAEAAAQVHEEATGEAALVPPTEVDEWGIPVQSHAAEAFKAVAKFKELANAIRAAQRLFNEVANLPGGVFLTLPEVSSYRRGKKLDDGTNADLFVHEGLEQALHHVKNATPKHTVCPYQYADAPHPEKCRCCLGLNWTPAISTNVPPVCIDRAKKAHGVTEGE